MGIIGGLLVLAGLFLPWFSVSQYSYDQVQNVHFSPFLLVINASGKEAYFWFQLNLGATTVGIAAMTGAALGLLGGGTNSGRISGLGGIVSLVATGLFPACIPGYYESMKLNWGGVIAATGAICMMASVIVTLSFPRGRVSSLRARSSFPLKKIPLRKMFGIQLELTAIVGSTYSAYELSRIIYTTFSSGSVTLTVGSHPSWLYRLEMLLCLYTVIYWCARLVLAALDFFLIPKKFAEIGQDPDSEKRTLGPAHHILGGSDSCFDVERVS